MKSQMDKCDYSQDDVNDINLDINTLANDEKLTRIKAGTFIEKPMKLQK